MTIHDWCYLGRIDEPAAFLSGGADIPVCRETEGGDIRDLGADFSSAIESMRGGIPDRWGGHSCLRMDERWTFLSTRIDSNPFGSRSWKHALKRRWPRVRSRLHYECICRSDASIQRISAA